MAKTNDNGPGESRPVAKDCCLFSYFEPSAAALDSPKIGR